MRPGARLRLASLAPLLLLLASCGSRGAARYEEYVPPRLDLARFGALGMVEFGDAEGSALGSPATAEFLAALHAAQPGTPVLELGDLASALPGCSGNRVDAAAIRELAAREHVSALWVGTLSESLESPRLAIDAVYGAASASARRKASLSVRLFDGASGATIWSASSERTIPVMAVDGSLRGISNVRTTPAEEARAILVRDLVEDVTADLRGQWIER
jgi:hypothetical protein